jgi:hypothetical protein
MSVEWYIYKSHLYCMYDDRHQTGEPIEIEQHSKPRPGWCPLNSEEEWNRTPWIKSPTKI